MKRTRINPISDKKRAQLKAERLLTGRLIIKQDGKCKCGRKLGWGSAKHEKIFRSRDGDPTSEENCEVLCLLCHGKEHHLKLVVKE